MTMVKAQADPIECSICSQACVSWLAPLKGLQNCLNFEESVLISHTNHDLMWRKGK